MTDRPPSGEAIVATFRSLALAAGERIMEIRRGADLGTRAKADDSPVTMADEAADALIRAGLSSAFPGLDVVTEEHAASRRLAAGRRFVLVDPLDGTKEFVRGRGEFTVNIALIEDGRPVHGVVLAPAIGRMFRTTPEGGAVEEEAPFEAPPRPIRVAVPDPAALRVVASRSHRDAATEAYIARYPVAAFRSAGSSLKFCLVAAGEADLYPRLGRTMEWDTAAGHAVLRAAGGEVRRLDDLSPLTYGKPGWENPFFVAHAPGVMPEPL